MNLLNNTSECMKHLKDQCSYRAQAGVIHIFLNIEQVSMGVKHLVFVSATALILVIL